MRLIELTYYRPEKKYGGNRGPTEKKFFLNPLQISQLTPYTDSTKLVLINGDAFEVVETKDEIMTKSNRSNESLYISG